MNHGIATAKEIARSRALAARAALPRTLVRRDSEALSRHLLALAAWHHARVVAAFVGVGGEPETWTILAATLGAGKVLLLPRVSRRACGDGDGSSRLEFHGIRELGELVPGRFGLLEPPRSAPRGQLLTAELILVPGVAFDPWGGRLGFGKGYYDRALAPLVQGQGQRPLRVGVCFREAITASPLPTTATDVTMHALLTEDGLLSTRRPGEGAGCC